MSQSSVLQTHESRMRHAEGLSLSYLSILFAGDSLGNWLTTSSIAVTVLLHAWCILEASEPRSIIFCPFNCCSAAPNIVDLSLAPVMMMHKTVEAAFRLAPQRSVVMSAHRIGQLQRHFSSSQPCRKEIQDAYILSAARTPTAKVRSRFPLQNHATHVYH